MEQSAIPVLACGGGLTLTGVIRIFGRAHVPVYTICGRTDVAAYCRWYRKPPRTGANQLKPRELAGFLAMLPLERAVLVPCADDWLQAVANLPPSLARRFPSSIGSAALIETMVNKWRFAELLRAQRVLHPETYLISSREHLGSLPEESFQGKILKPLWSMEFAGKHHVKGYLVSSRTEALKFSANIDFPILLQDYIPGPPTAHFFIDGFTDRRCRICARLARQRLRMYPTNLGNSSLTVSVPLAEVAEAAAVLDQLLPSVSYRGIFSAEFKYDHRDGHFKILEINARPWWYVEFAARCGVDVCRLAYLDALDLPVEPVTDYQSGRRCVFLLHDFEAYRELRRNGLKFWPWIRSCMGADGALLTSSDPRPGITHILRAATTSLRHCVSKQMQ